MGRFLRQTTVLDKFHFCARRICKHLCICIKYHTYHTFITSHTHPKYHSAQPLGYVLNI
jgi:hypothetical protein